jgi:hypothetical protein
VETHRASPGRSPFFSERTAREKIGAANQPDGAQALEEPWGETRRGRAHFVGGEAVAEEAFAKQVELMGFIAFSMSPRPPCTLLRAYRRCAPQPTARGFDEPRSYFFSKHDASKHDQPPERSTWRRSNAPPSLPR